MFRQAHQPPDQPVSIDPLPPPGDVRTLAAQESRLAFTVPPSRLPLEATVERLLDWEALPLRVVPAADDAPTTRFLDSALNQVGLVLKSLLVSLPPLPSGPVPRPVSVLTPVRAPRNDETALEIPWHLVLSPPPSAGFTHAAGLVTRGPRTELWHTRLGVRKADAVDETDPAGRTVRAVWARDVAFDPAFPPSESDEGPLRTSLTPRNRHDIVRLTSDTTLAARKPVAVERLMLSALGGWLDSTGTWDPPAEISLEHWRHRATLGRDSYVRVITRGYLFPLGHRAVKVTITERMLEQATPDAPPGAYLRKREFIIVRQPVKEYPAPGQPHDGRAFPLRRVRIATLVTPDLSDAPSFGPPSAGAFMPMVGNPKQPLQFALVGTDWAGRTVEFTAPLAFVEGTKALDVDAGKKLIQHYLEDWKVDDDRRRRPIVGQPVAFGPEGSPGFGDTTLEVEALSLGAEGPADDVTTEDLTAAKQAAFYPTVARAEVRLRAAEVLRDKAVGTQKVTIASAFVEHGFGNANAGDLLLKVEDAPVVSFDERSDRVGGVATPNLKVTGFSRGKGPVGGDLEVIRQNRFDPATFFSGARLLGGVSLDEVIDLDPMPTLEQAPTIRTASEGKLLVTELKWERPPLKPDSKRLFLPEEKKASLALAARFETDLELPENSTAEVTGDLRNFAFQLLGSQAKFLVVNFSRLSYRSRTGTKPDVQVEVSGVEFAGHLQFVEGLRHFLPTMGKPFSVDVHSTSVVGSLTTSLPSIAVGVFSLQNISIATAMEIPFDARPARFRFSFCSRENPFLLTVSAFGGGGHVAVDCGLDEQVSLDVSLQFGATIAFNIGVASGGVEVLAGIQIAMEDSTATLSGFCRIAGEVRVLGIVTVSCHLSMTLSYIEPPVDKAIGQATFHAEIDVGFFEKSVSKQVERRFGGQSDPTFAELMDPSDWATYCQAFAPLGAAS